MLPLPSWVQEPEGGGCYAMQWEGRCLQVHYSSDSRTASCLDQRNVFDVPTRR